MCRAARWCLSLLLAGAASPLVFADEVESYLQQRDLKRLLVSHLEQRLEFVSAEEKAELVLKLSTLYAEMLDATTDAGEQVLLEERSRKLLTQTVSGGTEELRLALLRNAYRRAEKIAEDHRLRLSTPEEVESAKRNLNEIIPQLTALRQQLKERAETTERRHTRSSGTESITLGEAATKAHEQLARCTFLAAWATYYQAWLNAKSEIAKTAEPMFGNLLSAETSMPQPSEVSVDLREIEAVARSILGMALCKSVTSTSGAALEWIALLEEPNAFEAIRMQAPIWRLVIHLEHGEYADARDVLDQYREAGNEIPTPWLRLVAVNALEDLGRTRLSSDMAKSMMTELASRGELEQVLDLASRYGTQALGASGFAPQYVQGIINYQAARKSHASEIPTREKALVDQYDVAATNLAAALKQPDSMRYPAPSAACLRLIAWCRYFQSRFVEAKESFLKAAEGMTGNDAAEATWMAIVSLDKLVTSGRNDELQKQLNELITRFVRDYPSSEHTPQLVLRQAVTQPDATKESIEDLLAIAPESDVYGQARRRASDLRYQQFRAAPAVEKVKRGNDFLNVAVPLISSTARAADSADATETQRHIARCRQVLEVAFSDGVDRLQAARSALESLDQLRQESQVDLSSHINEIDCRRVQERLASDDPTTAAQLADGMWERSADGLWSRLASRAMFRFGHDRWKDAQGAPESQKQGLDLVAKYGGRVLHEFRDDPNALNQSSALAYHAAVAEATLKLWETTGEAERGKAALFLFEKLLAAKPRNAMFLRGTAALSEKFDKPEQALECWRKIVAGSPAQSEGWFEARFNLIRLLAVSDPARAREVMDQHKSLNPDYGPDPWGGRLKGLDAQIPAASSDTPAEDQAAGGAGGTGEASP